MRNMLLKLGIKAAVLLAIAVHWALDDVVIFLPTSVVDSISRYMFKMTGNGYRFDKWLDFWN